MENSIKNPARRLLAYCDGGLGNRLNALVTGILLARMAGFDLEVVWPVNNWCGARFCDLISMTFLELGAYRDWETDRKSVV